MEIRADARIPFSREIVFAAYRDEIKDLLPYLPNVRGIDIKSRKENGPVIEFVNEWKGGGDIPAALRAVLSESVLSWTDYASWNGNDLVCDWRTETHAFTGAIQCRGRNTFIDDGVDRTLLEIRGNMEIDPKKIRGVPGFLAGKVARSIEEFLVAKIQANLVETAKGLAKYLEERHKTKG